LMESSTEGMEDVGASSAVMRLLPQDRSQRPPDAAAPRVLVVEEGLDRAAFEVLANLEIEVEHARRLEETEGLDERYSVVLLALESATAGEAEMLRARRMSDLPFIFFARTPPKLAEAAALRDLAPFDYVILPSSGELLRAKIEMACALREQTLRAHRRSRELERQLAAERRRAAEAEQLAAREQQRLAATDRQRDELLATLAHELRNPLAPVVTGLELLRMQGDFDPEIARTRVAMERQIGHLVRLLDDLLDASRISRGKIRLRRDWLDLRDLLRHAVEPWRKELQRRRHVLTLELPDAPVLCHGDRVRLSQVVDNLVANAVRHTGTDGHIRVCLVVDGGEALLRVVDDGPGIAPELIDRVFDMFVQAKRGNGLGLGLTLVQQIVRFHGGDVRLASQSGLGTTVEVQLPLARDAEPTARHGAAPQDEVAHRLLRIVLVEDERDVRETMQALLQAWGHTVEIASTGLDGVDTVLAARPDVVLMDIGLPDVDGHVAARRVRDLMGSQAPRLVALTGFGQESDRRRARDAGFDAHLVKPVAPETLRATLYDVLEP
jgi:signal transduction histidine kinase